MGKKEAAFEAKIDASWHAGIIGHATVLDVLDRACAQGRLAHAYLFVGPEGSGKVTVARALAAKLLGTAMPETHPDYTFVERERDAKTGKPHADILLDQVHKLTSRLSLGSMMNGWRVAILDGAQLLNKESANALLKTLEEPHERTMLLLAATSAEEVMPTIRSRCQVLRFNRVPTAEMVTALTARMIDGPTAELYARLADGRPGMAVSFANDPARLQEMFSVRDAILAMPATSVADRFGLIEKAVPPKVPFQDAVDLSGAWLDLVAELLRDALLIRLGAGERIVHVDALERLTSWSTQLDPARVLAKLEESRKMLSANVSPRAALERVVASF